MEGAWLGMKLKYYLRGAGIALILAVLLTNVSHKNEVSASSDALGKKVEEADTTEENNITLAEIASKQDNSAEDKVESDNAEFAVDSEVSMIDMTAVLDEEDEVSDMETDTVSESVSVDLSISTEFITEEKLSEQAVTEENLIYEEEQKKMVATLTIEDGAQEAYLLNIVGGDDSGTVSRKLYNAGLVDSASEFDAFLMQHGYDKKIRVGTVEVPFGATWLEIAEKLAGK